MPEISWDGAKGEKAWFFLNYGIKMGVFEQFEGILSLLGMFGSQA